VFLTRVFIDTESMTLLLAGANPRDEAIHIRDICVILLPLMTPPMMVATAWKLILAPAGGLLDGVLLRTGLLDQPISFLGTTVPFGRRC
jgi:ABC-type sugar transport system permease subunit